MNNTQQAGETAKVTREALRIELWSMLSDVAKKEMLPLKESYLDSLMADIDSYAAGMQSPTPAPDAVEAKAEDQQSKTVVKELFDFLEELDSALTASPSPMYPDSPLHYKLRRILLGHDAAESTPPVEAKESVRGKVKARINQLNQADGEFCKDRWNMDLPDFQRKMARELSNSVTFARQELQEVLKWIDESLAGHAEGQKATVEAKSADEKNLRNGIIHLRERLQHYSLSTPGYLTPISMIDEMLRGHLPYTEPTAHAVGQSKDINPVESFKIWMQAAPRTGCAGFWVNASGKLPMLAKCVHVKFEGLSLSALFWKNDKGDYMVSIDGFDDLDSSFFHRIQWLDETTTSHAEGEKGAVGFAEWIPASNPPKECGRYWCYLEEVNDLGISHFQWNVSYSTLHGFQPKDGGRVTHWMELQPPPKK